MDHELFLVFLHALENYWKPSWGVPPGRFSSFTLRQDLSLYFGS